MTTEEICHDLSFRHEEIGPKRYDVIPRLEPCETEMLDRWREFYARKGTPHIVCRVYRMDGKQRRWRWRLYIPLVRTIPSTD